MRLYLNDKEARIIRTALVTCQVQMVPEFKKITDVILDRLELCIKLQHNERGSKEDA